MAMYAALLIPAIKIARHKHRLLFALWLVLTSACNALAQKGLIETGMHTGVAMTRLYEPEKLKNDFYFRTVPEVGLQLSYGIGCRFSVGAELNYTRITTQREGSLPPESAFPQAGFRAGSYAGFTERVALDYLEIPVLINGQIGCKLRLFTGIGPFVGIRLGGHSSISGSGNTRSHPEPAAARVASRDITGDTRTINLGGCERLGLSYQLGKGRIWLETRYSFGLIDIWKKGRNMAANQTDQLVLRFAYTVLL